MITIVEILKRSLNIKVENSIEWEKMKVDVNYLKYEKKISTCSDDKIYSMISKFEIIKSENNIEALKKLTNHIKEKKIRPGIQNKEKFEEIIDELF